ncbi:MAG: FAD-dependent oxidoreductase [Alphaproteobacteria bacterium]|nr:FAD-dependent oxidoreductase [Alphaproteobacteria bacterium]
MSAAGELSDLVVIGGGSGGVRAARRAAGFGARVVLVEDRALGGTCVNLGCVPKKLFHHAAAVPEQARDARGFGWDLPAPALDWTRLVANKNREIRRLNDAYQNTLDAAGVRIVRGRARLRGANEVVVDGESFRAGRILLAVGMEPWRPSGVPAAWVSDDLFHLKDLPREVIVVGGGYIACEFASIFCGLGVETTLIHRRSRLLRGFDAVMSEHLAHALRSGGARLLLDAAVDVVRERGGGYEVVLADGREVRGDGLLWAVGRRPRVAGLGLEDAGARLDGGGKIEVDGDYCTSVSGVFALGDAASRGRELTPVALAEGECFAAKHFGGGAADLVYENIPTAVFTHPPLAEVGLTAEAARARGYEVQVWDSDFGPLRLALSGRGERVYIRVVSERGSGRLLGVQMLGEEGPELAQVFALALAAGATKDDLDRCFAIHPTVSEEFVSLRDPSNS